MNFELVIGNLGKWDRMVIIGRYYPQFKVIAVDSWTGEESEDYMADILSHEFIHHLLYEMFGSEAGANLDNFRNASEEEIDAVRKGGISQNFAIRVSLKLCEGEYTLGNGII